MVTPEPASSAAPGLRTRSTEPRPQELAVIARQRGRVAFAVLLSVGAVVAVLVDEVGRWAEATPLGFTVGDNGYVATVDQHGPATVSTLKNRFPRLAGTTVAGEPLWRQLPQNRPVVGIVVDGEGAVWRRADTPAVELRFYAGAQVARGGQVNGCPEEPDAGPMPKRPSSAPSRSSCSTVPRARQATPPRSAAATRPASPTCARQCPIVATQRRA